MPGIHRSRSGSTRSCSCAPSLSRGRADRRPLAVCGYGGPARPIVWGIQWQIERELRVRELTDPATSKLTRAEVSGHQHWMLAAAVTAAGFLPVTIWLT